MNTQTKYARLCAMFFVLFFSSIAIAGTPKVEVCHVPADAEDTSHTINVSERALPSHLAHGDYVGACVEDGFCPCFTPSELADLGDVDFSECGDDVGQTAVGFTNGNAACTGSTCIGDPSFLSCLTFNGVLETMLGIAEADDNACAEAIRNICAQ